MRLTLTIVALLLLPACGSDGYDIQRDGRPVEQVRDGETFGFGSIEQVRGTRFFTLPIIAARGGGSKSSFSSYDPEDVRNRIIVDSVRGESRKILPNEAFQISNWIALGDSSSDGSSLSVAEAASTAKGGPVEHYLVVVRRPAAKPETPPTFDLLAGEFAAPRQSWIAKNLSNFKGAWLLDDGKIATISASGGRQYYRVYDPGTFALVVEKELRL